MPELPEIRILARQMDEALRGKRITHVDITQPKCLNLPVDDFRAAVIGARVEHADDHGKWIFVKTNQGHLLINLGMGGEILLVTRDTLPEKHRIIFDFDDETCLAINFWWFGYVHYAAPDALSEHEMTAKLGPNALDMKADALRELLKGRRGQIKNYLLKQSEIAGIGNFYVHDILFEAGLHPQRKANTLSDADFDALHAAMQHRLQLSLEQHGAAYEVDLYGDKGGFTQDEFLVAYREGEACPVCGTTIEKIVTGSTSSFICPPCQSIEKA
jgi:formamidopyrimidine-DNA glycosylase